MTADSRLNRSVEPDAEAIAIQALSFLAGRPDDLARFLALSGIGPASLRRSAADPGFLGGVLDFLLQDEPLLLSFAEESGFAPAAIGAARRRLAGAPSE
jgi:hypothetical protein